MTVLLLVSVLVVLPALTGLLLGRSSLPTLWAHKSAFPIGAAIVYREEEISTHPLPDADEVRPAERGEYYYCRVLKYLRVADVLSDGRIIAITRDQTRLCLWPNDSSLRKARFRERLSYRQRFPQL